MTMRPVRPDDDNALKQIRRARGLSQQAAADKCGVSRTMFSSWESQTRELSLSMMETMVEKLALTPDEYAAVRRWWGTAKKTRNPARRRHRPKKHSGSLVADPAGV